MSNPEPGRRADRALLELAPLIYMAWADGALSHEESARIRERLERRQVSPGVQQVLEEWLNPERPPTPTKLYELLELMKAARGRTRRRMSTLADFRRLLGKSAVPEEAAESPELRALHDIESALGLTGEAVLQVIAEPNHSDTTALPGIDNEQLMMLVEGDRYDIRRYIFGLLQRPVFQRPDDMAPAEHREKVLLWCKELARLGTSSYGYPHDYDGEDNIPKAVAAFETLAYHDLSLMVKFGVQFGLFGGSILQLGTRKHHDAYLQSAGSLELPGCFAMTETGHGSNVRDIETIASYDVATQEFVIDSPARIAWKDYIGNAALHAHMATVFAQLEVNGQRHGVHAFLVPIRDRDGHVLPGVTIEDNGVKVGLNGIDNGRIGFSSVRVPRANLLDRFGSVSRDGTYNSSIKSANRRFFTMLGTLVAGRISIAAGACAASKLGLNIAARYAERRTQFGPENGPEQPILGYRAVQRRLLPQIARTYALDFAIHDTVKQIDTVLDENRALELRVAALKAAASEHAVTTLQSCRELCGGQGYMWQNRIGELRADTDVFTTFEGANDVLWQLVAKGLLTGLREQFEEMRVWTAIKQMTARAGSAVTDLNPVATRKTDVEHLRDPDFHAAALAFREDRLLRSVAGRLRYRISRGMECAVTARRRSRSTESRGR